MQQDQWQIGTRIRQAREALSMSQEDLASKVGKNQKAISQYEKGQRRMFVNDLPRFADALKVPVAYFFEALDRADDTDQLILAQLHRLPSYEARQTLLHIVMAFCAFAEGNEDG